MSPAVPAPVAIALIAIVVLFAVAVAYEICTRESRITDDRPAPRHAARTGTAPRHARTEFADPAGVSDPEGEKWLQAIKAPALPAVAPPLGMPWLPAPVPVHHEKVPLSLAELASAGLPAAGLLPMLPPDPPPADTGVLPVTVCELGCSTEEFVDLTFAEAEREMARIFAGIDRAAGRESGAAA